jgi:hypothetical protein
MAVPLAVTVAASGDSHRVRSSPRVVCLFTGRSRQGEVPVEVQLFQLVAVRCTRLARTEVYN